MEPSIIERWTDFLVKYAGGVAAGRRALARELELSESTVYRWTVDDTTPGKLTRDLINGKCDALGVALVYVEGRDTNASPQ